MRSLIAVMLILAASFTGFAQTRPASAATPAPAQQPPPQQGPPAYYADSPTRVFAIRYVDSRSIERLLSSFGVPISREPDLNALAIKAPEKTLNAIDEVIKKFDVPANARKKVEITAYLVLGSAQAEADAMPAVLRPVIDQLRSVMAYKGYRVLDTLIASGREGEGIRQDGMLVKLADSDPEPSRPSYSFRVVPRVSGEGADQAIHLETLLLNLFLGGGKQLDIGTSVDVKKGQQVVVGKATILDRAVILILSAKIVE